MVRLHPSAEFERACDLTTFLFCTFRQACASWKQIPGRRTAGGLSMAAAKKDPSYAAQS
jgi:hypothetical protein